MQRHIDGQVRDLHTNTDCLLAEIADGLVDVVSALEALPDRIAAALNPPPADPPTE